MTLDEGSFDGDIVIPDTGAKLSHVTGIKLLAAARRRQRCTEDGVAHLVLLPERLQRICRVRLLYRGLLHGMNDSILMQESRTFLLDDT